MSKPRISFAALLTAWGAAAAFGALVFVLLLALGGWSLIQALWMAAVATLVLGLFFQFVFCRPLPPPMSLGGRPAAASQPAAATAKSAPAQPAPAKPAPAAASAAEARPPERLATPEGAPDDLKRIRGVGPALESMLHGMGIYHFRQIAAWGPAEVAWCDENLEGFKGRVSRDDWVAQAKVLAAGGETAVSRRQDADGGG